MKRHRSAFINDQATVLNSDVTVRMFRSDIVTVMIFRIASHHRQRGNLINIYRLLCKLIRILRGQLVASRSRIGLAWWLDRS